MDFLDIKKHVASNKRKMKRQYSHVGCGAPKQPGIHDLIRAEQCTFNLSIHPNFAASTWLLFENL